MTIGPIAQSKLQGWVGALDATELWRHGVRRDGLVAGGSSEYSAARLGIGFRY